MARIDWVLLCEPAFIDRQDRMSIFSIVRSLPAPRLPLAVASP